MCVTEAQGNSAGGQIFKFICNLNKKYVSNALRTLEHTVTRNTTVAMQN